MRGLCCKLINFNIRGMPYNSVPAGVMNSWIRDGVLCVGLRLYQPSHHSRVCRGTEPNTKTQSRRTDRLCVLHCVFSNSLAASWWMAAQLIISGALTPTF